MGRRLRKSLPGDGAKRTSSSKTTKPAVDSHQNHLSSGGADGHRRRRTDETEAAGLHDLHRYEIVVQQTRDIILFVRRQDGRILEANPAASAAYGYTRDELLARTVHDLRGPEAGPLVRAQMEEAAASGVLFETEHRRKDGTVFPVEVSSRGAGEDTLVSVVRDISERRDAERRERRQKQEAERRAAELDATFNSLAHPTVVINTRGELLRTNPAYDQTFRIPEAWRRLTIAERAKRWNLQTWTGEPVDGAASPAARALAGEETANALHKLPRQDGSFMYLSTSSAPIRIGDEIVGAVTVFADITDRVRAEQALQEADRRKNDFLAVLSHELRNPLAPITNSLYILDHAPAGGEQASRAREVIARQVMQLSNLVNDLLDVTRITRNKIRLNKERLELNDITRRAVEDNRSVFEKAGVNLDLQSAPRLVPVLADRTRVAQVIGNLLQNAAKFARRGGSTRVIVEADTRDAIVRVVDDGVGIDPQTLGSLFQPFTQADQTLDRSRGGLGLGLALVKGLIELHGGTVTARSEGVGKGAEFVIRLPLDAGPARAQRAGLDRSERKTRRILIIEDKQDAADSLREVLELGDHTVEVAYSGPEGITKARAFRPELVLCDIGLPGMDGYDVARVFRSDEVLKHTYLLALSGYAQREDMERATQAGFDRHLPKPPAMHLLEDLLERLPSDERGARRSGVPGAPPTARSAP